MRVLVARAGRHSRQRRTVSAPPRVIMVTDWQGTGPSGHRCGLGHASRSGNVRRGMWCGGAPGDPQCADRPLVSRLPELGLRLAAGTAPAGPH
jgi:hypothetical protein